MNKTLNINLGGYPFIMNEDAYEHLKNYLDAIHRHFSRTEGYEEITHDIEARLAELFQENLGNRPIVNFQDIDDAIAIMGKPEDFGADPMTGESDFEQADSTIGEKFKIKTGKRLFRDADEEVIGGVASGLAAYFGIPDPIWVRLFFVLFTISGGVGIPLYLIMWAIMPQAKTAGDRLAMRGERINVSNISRVIQEEFEHISSKMSELGEELAGKKKILTKKPMKTKGLRAGSLL